jgi:hypothetical protein
MNDDSTALAHDGSEHDEGRRCETTPSSTYFVARHRAAAPLLEPAAYVSELDLAQSPSMMGSAPPPLGSPSRSRIEIRSDQRIKRDR